MDEVERGGPTALRGSSIQTPDLSEKGGLQRHEEPCLVTKWKEADLRPYEGRLLRPPILVGVRQSTFEGCVICIPHPGDFVTQADNVPPHLCLRTAYTCVVQAPQLPGGDFHVSCVHAVTAWPCLELLLTHF